MLLFIVLYKVVLLLSLWMKSLSITVQMKVTEQYFPVAWRFLIDSLDLFSFQ